jgi:hypothetical protein
MTLAGTFEKSPAEREPFSINVASRVGGESIKHVAWSSSEPDELIVGTGVNGLGAPTVNGTNVGVWLAGGAAPKFYTVHALITTSTGRVVESGFGLQLRDDCADRGAARLTRGGVGAISPSGSASPQLFDTTHAIQLGLLTTALVLPGVWAVSRAMKVKNFNGWKLVGTALVVSASLTALMLLWASMRARASGTN